jgi:hypothetical protein
MAVAFDAQSQEGYGTTSRTTLGWTHTPVGTPGIVVVTMQNTVNPGAFSEQTYGGEVMTKVASTPVSCHMWYLLGPPAGAQTVTLTWANTTPAGSSASTFTGTASVGTFAEATGTGPTDASVAVSCGLQGMVIDSVKFNNETAVTVGADQTQRNQNTYGSTNQHTGASSTEPGGGPITMSWTDVIASSAWAIVALPIQGTAAQAAAGTLTSSGAITKKTGKAAVGTLTLAGSIGYNIFRNPSGLFARILLGRRIAKVLATSLSEVSTTFYGVGAFLKKVDGDFLLKADGDKIILVSSVTATAAKAVVSNRVGKIGDA